MIRPRLLAGKGMWIWQIAKCEGGDVRRIVEKARWAGLSHILVKVGQDNRAYDSVAAHELYYAARDAGVEFIGWHYVGGTTMPEIEAVRAAENIIDYHSHIYVINAEKEFKGQPERAKDFMRALRGHSHLRRCVLLALSSFYLPRNHPDFPWDQFTPYCDLWMPQIYWHKNDPVWALEEALRQSANFGIPRFVTGAVYPEAARNAAMVKSFCDAVSRKKLWGANFWSWQHCTAEMWDVIREARFE